jgi:hypothetical protein
MCAGLIQGRPEHTVKIETTNAQLGDQILRRSNRQWTSNVVVLVQGSIKTSFVLFKYYGGVMRVNQGLLLITPNFLVGAP